MNRRLRVTGGIFLLAVGLLVPFSSGQNKFVEKAHITVVPKPPAPQQGKVILVLQTRDYLVTVRSKAGENRYSVATLQGIVLAEHASVNELKECFPELHDVVQGIAWAGDIEPARSLRKLFPK